MTANLKKILALCLATVLVLGVFSACGGNAGTGESTTTVPSTEAEVTQPGEEGKTLKILTLGHSLAVDCGHMLALIAAAEGYENLKVGTLYYSGCPLKKHVEYLTNNSPEYNLYISTTDNATSIPEITNGVTMQYALQYDYWDLIIMQGGVFEIADDATYKSGLIQTIQDYVKDNCMNPNIRFAWHMPWAPPTTNSLRDQYPYENNTYYTNYLPYGDNRTALYQTITKCVSDNILTDETFEFMIPTGTAMENALSSYLEETDLHRDYVHATDLARVMNTYVWYCRLAGIEKLDEIKLDAIPVQFFKSTVSAQDRVLTDMEKAIILESVNNALANPLQMTQSQYTEAPTA